MSERGSTVDRYLKPGAVAAKGEAKELGFLADAGGSVRLIDFVLKSGDRFALPYAYLIEVKLTGGDTVELTFTEKIVTIRGRSLAALYQHLLANTARRIEESDTGFDDERMQSWVESIVVTARV